MKYHCSRYACYLAFHARSKNACQERMPLVKIFGCHGLDESWGIVQTREHVCAASRHKMKYHEQQEQEKLFAADESDFM